MILQTTYKIRGWQVHHFRGKIRCKFLLYNYVLCKAKKYNHVHQGCSYGNAKHVCFFPNYFFGFKCNNNIIIIYNIYRALIPNGPKVLYIIKITTKS